MRTKCDYIKCTRTAHWVVETSYSPVCLCNEHMGVNYLSIAAKIKSMHRGTEPKIEADDSLTQ